MSGFGQAAGNSLGNSGGGTGTERTVNHRLFSPHPVEPYATG